MASERARIERANAQVQTIQQRINQLDRPVKEAEEAIKAHEEKTEGLAETAGKKVVDAMRDSAVEVAEKIGEKQGRVWTRAFGALTVENKAVGDETKDVYKKKVKTARFRDAINLTQEEAGGGHEPAAPAAPESEHH